MSELNTTQVCYIHPKRETQLRCNRCEQPICTKCATHTPTGYRCPECIRTQQKIFVTTKWFDYIIAAVITGIAAYLGSFFTSLGFYSVLISIGIGYGAVWSVKRAIQNRRSPLLKYIMSGTALIISLIPAVGFILTQLQQVGFIYDVYSIIWKLANAVVISGAIFYQLKN